MPPQKRIASIAQSTAHHAVSGMCCVNPHLRRACVGLGRRTCRIDLLAEQSCPSEFIHSDPIRLAVSALRAKFMEITEATGFRVSDFCTALLVYEFPPGLDDYSSNCCVSITSRSGYALTKAVDYRGNGAEVLNITIGPGAVTEPPPAGARSASTESMNLKPQSEAPADSGGP